MAKDPLKIIRNSLRIIRRSLLNFGSNNPIGMAGTTAFFAIFSIAPTLIIIISVFGFIAGNDIIREKLFEEVNTLVGMESSRLLRNAIDNYQISDKSVVGAILGGAIFLVSATTLFSIMQNSINFIFRVQVRSKIKLNLIKLAKDRIFSFGIILILGFVLLISLVIDAAISFLRDFLTEYFNPDFLIIARISNAALSFVVITSIFAVIYRFLPDIRIKWKASWFGALFTALLFFAGKYLIGLIIGNSQLGVVYGAASSFVIILMWIYFVSLIFYFGVELTNQYSKFYHHGMEPLKYSVRFEISQNQ
jgi:membrane protein